MDFATLVPYAALMAFTPGPNNIMSMSNASRLGFRKSLPFNFGILSGFCVISVICALLSQALHSFIPKIKLPMLIAGAIYMLYLAWHTYKSSGDITENHAKSGFLSGLLLQFINPKLYLSCIISLEAYILPVYQENTPMLMVFALLIAFTGFLFTVLWALFGSLFRILFSKYAKITNAIMALLLVYCAVSLFF